MNHEKEQTGAGASVTGNDITGAPPAPPALRKLTKGALSRIPVELTFEGYEPIRFICRPRMSDEAQRDHDAFNGLTPAERDARKFSHHLAVLTDVIISEPEGIEDFPPPAQEWDGGTEEMQAAYLSDLRARFADYFGDPDEDQNRLIIDAGYNRYFIKIVPREYL